MIVIIKKTFCIAGPNWGNPLTKEQRIKIENIKKKLIVSKKDTKAFKRTKISSQDDRPSARAMGSIFGIGILSLIFCLIDLPDIPKLWRDLTYVSCVI